MDLPPMDILDILSNSKLRNGEQSNRYDPKQTVKRHSKDFPFKKLTNKCLKFGQFSLCPNPLLPSLPFRRPMQYIFRSKCVVGFKHQAYIPGEKKSLCWFITHLCKIWDCPLPRDLEQSRPRNLLVTHSRPPRASPSRTSGPTVDLHLLIYEVTSTSTLPSISSHQLRNTVFARDNATEERALLLIWISFTFCHFITF